MEKKSPRELIISSLKEKASLKQDVYLTTLNAFNEMKLIAEEMVKDLSKETAKFDKRVKLSYKEKTWIKKRFVKKLKKLYAKLQ